MEILFVPRFRSPVRKAAGFTLLEMLIVLAIFGVVMTGVATMFSAGYQAYQKASSANAIVHNLNLVKDEVAVTFRSSGITSSGGAGGSPTFNDCDLGSSRCTSIDVPGIGGRRTWIRYDDALMQLDACFEDAINDTDCDSGPKKWIGTNLTPPVTVENFFVRCFSNNNSPISCTGGSAWRYEFYTEASVPLANGGKLYHAMIESIIPPGTLLQAGRFPF